MSEPAQGGSLFSIEPDPAGEPLLDAVARGLASPGVSLAALPTMTNVALGDPYLAQELVALHRGWELRPAPAHGLLARLRTRLAWWLLGPELRQASQVHATVTRILDSVIVQLDQDRAARRRIEEQLAYGQEPS